MTSGAVGHASNPDASRGVGLLHKFCDPRVVYWSKSLGTHIELKHELRLGIDPDGPLDVFVLPSEREALVLD